MFRDPFRAMKWQLIGVYLAGAVLFLAPLGASAIYYYSTATNLIASTSTKDRPGPLEAKKPPTKSVPSTPEIKQTKSKDKPDKIVPDKPVLPVPDTKQIKPKDNSPKKAPDELTPPAPEIISVKPREMPSATLPKEKSDVSPPTITKQKPDTPPVPKAPIDRTDDIIKVVQNPKFPGVRILKAEQVNRKLIVKAQVLESQRDSIQSALKPLADEVVIIRDKADADNVISDLLRDAKLPQLLPENIVWQEGSGTYRIADAVDDATCEKLTALLEANLELLSEAREKKIGVERRPKDLTAQVQKEFEKNDFPGVRTVKATQKDQTLTINVIALESQLPELKSALSSLGLTVKLDRTKSPTVQEIVKSLLDRGNLVKSVDSVIWDAKSGKLEIRGRVNNSKERVEAFKKLKSFRKILEEAVGAKEDQMEIDVTNLEEPGGDP